MLIVDDEPEFLDLTKFFLEREGSFDVVTASSGRDALAKLQKEEYDALVCDYSMPGMDGLELLKIIRAQGMETPFVLLTGKGREDVAIEALNAGADFYVRKGTEPKTQYAEIVNSIRMGVSRRRAVDSASSSNTLLLRVFASIRDGICVLDKERTIVASNPVMDEWYPYRLPIVGKKCWEVFHPSSETEHDYDCPGKKALETGKVHSELLPRYDADGNRVGWIEVSGFPLVKGRDNEVDGVIEYARDVTEHMSLRENLVSELQIRRAMDKISSKLICPPASILEISKMVLDSAKELTSSRHGFVSSIDPITKSAMSWTITEMMGKGCTVEGKGIEFPIGPDGRYPGLWGHSLNTRKAFFSNNPREHEMFVGLPEGHVELENYLSVPVIIGGELVGLVSLANSPKGYSESDIEIISRLASIYAMAVVHERDVTSLREMEEQFRLFMDNSPTFAFIKDVEGRYAYINRHYRESLGRDEDEIIGHTDMDLWPEAAARRFRKDDSQVLESNKGVRLIETVAKEDGVLEYLTFKFPILDSSGRSKSIGGVSIDITDMRRVETALKVANEKLKILGGLTRHDSLNQLSALEGWLSLAMESKDPSELSKLISKMRTPIDSLRSQLEFAVEYERIGTVPLEWISVDEAVSEAQSALASDRLETICDVRDIEIYVDPMFSKVFQNLLMNTVKHGGHARRVKIEIDEREEGLAIIYSDDGAGVPSEEKEKIFEPGVGQNIGLGLYIVRQLLHTCNMTIKETGVHGKGARFEMLVPAESHRVKTSHR